MKLSAVVPSFFSFPFFSLLILCCRAINGALINSHGIGEGALESIDDVKRSEKKVRKKVGNQVGM